MDHQIYLIAPATAPAEAVIAALGAVLETQQVAALLLQRGGRSDLDYRAFARAVAPHAQGRDVAVLVEGTPALVRELGADGLHVAGGVGVVRAAIEALKPDLIVGAGDIRSRHDAMQKVEAGVDYVLFGPLSGPISAAQRELARWWAETMEIPAVLCDPQAGPDSVEAEGCEFIGLVLRTEPHL